MSTIVSGPVDIPELGLIFSSPEGFYEGSTLVGSSQADQVVAYDSDIDVEVVLRAGNDLATLGAGDDVISGGDGFDLLIGGAGDDLIFGGNDDDVLFGGSGNDIVAGGSGNDTIRGNGGDDVLIGGKGSDRLVTEAGEDILIGGAGADTFVLSSRATRGLDEFRDFDPTEDLIEIDRKLLPGYRDGFVSVESLEDIHSAIGIAYERSTGLLYYLPVEGAPVPLAQLDKGLDLKAADIKVE